MIHAEIYPSFQKVDMYAGEVKDATQVRSLCTYFHDLDVSGQLAELFEAPSQLSPEDRKHVEQEEGWIFRRQMTNFLPIIMVQFRTLWTFQELTSEKPQKLENAPREPCLHPTSVLGTSICRLSCRGISGSFACCALGYEPPAISV